MKKILLDANAILRPLLNDIPKQVEQIKKLTVQAQKGKIVLLVPEVIVFEVHYSLLKYYKLDKNTVAGMLESVVSAEYWQVESKNIFQPALNTYKNNNLSFVDCFLKAKSEAEAAKIFTFDKKLRKLD